MAYDYRKLLILLGEDLKQKELNYMSCGVVSEADFDTVKSLIVLLAYLNFHVVTIHSILYGTKIFLLIIRNPSLMMWITSSPIPKRNAFLILPTLLLNSLESTTNLQQRMSKWL